MRINTRQFLVNTLTDPGAWFNLGTAPITFSKSVYLGLSSLAVAGLCFTIRAGSEARKLGKNIPLIGNFFKNPGQAFLVDGAAGILIGAFALAAADPESGNDPKRAAIVLGAFGLGKIFRAVSVGMTRGSNRQAFTNSAGVVCTSAGLYAASPNAPAELVAAFAVAAATGVYLAIRRKPAHSIAQPEIIFAGCAAAAGTLQLLADNFEYAAANYIWTVACLSVDSLKKHKGVYEAWPYARLSR